MLAHRQERRQCDWPECPERIEVVELSKVVERMGRSGDPVIG